MVHASDRAARRARQIAGAPSPPLPKQTANACRPHGSGARVEQFMPHTNEDDPSRISGTGAGSAPTEVTQVRSEQPAVPGARSDAPQPADGTDRSGADHATLVSTRRDLGAGHAVPAVPGYEIECAVGRGGLGVVYKARHLTLKRTVALKMMLSGGHAGPDELARFGTEAEAVARLQHPNIVQIHEVGAADGRPYCALEFVEGGTLAALLNGRPLPAGEAAALVGTLARAMQLAHSRNVVHRDLKPANVLLQPEESGRRAPAPGGSRGGTGPDRSGTTSVLRSVPFVPKIADFGLARRLDSDSGQTQAGAVMGTPSYMAPEQAAGRANEAGPAADVYALGAILYECLTGHPPFRGASVVETLDQVRTREPVPPSRVQAGVPLDLETVCLKCLRKEPEGRYASAAELADDLDRYQNGEPVRARPVGASERALKWVRRNPALAGALAAVALALTAGATASYLGYLEARTQTDLARQNQTEAEAQARLAEAGQREAERQAGIARAQTALAEDRKQKAEEQAEIARFVTQFLAGLFEDNTPVAFTSRVLGARPPDAAALTALDVVERGAQKLKTELRDNRDKRVRAALLERIGNVYMNLGRPREARPLLVEALELNRTEFGPESPEYATTCLGVGLLHVALADPREADRWVGLALDLRRKIASAAPSRENEARVADALFYLGFLRCLLHQFAEAEGLLDECRAVRERHAGEGSLEVVTTLCVLVFAKAMAPHRTNESEVEKLLTRIQTINDKLAVKSPLADLVSLVTKAKFAERFDTKVARELYEDLDAKVIGLLGEDHILVAFTRIQFANFLKKSDTAGAARLYRLVVASYRKALGPDALPLVGRLLDLAAVEQRRGHAAEAQAALRDAVRIHRKHDSTQPGDVQERSACLLRLAESLSQKPFPVQPKKANKSAFELEVARYWVRAARALAERPREPDDDEFIRAYFHTQAVQRLSAAATGAALDPAALQKDADFEPLLARADFKELLAKLAQTRTPPAKGER